MNRDGDVVPGGVRGSVFPLPLVGADFVDRAAVFSHSA